MMMAEPKRWDEISEFNLNSRRMQKTKNADLFNKRPPDVGQLSYNHK